MKFLIAATALLQGAAAFPAVMNNPSKYQKRTGANSCSTSPACDQDIPVSDADIGYNANSPTPAQQASAARNQGGLLDPVTVFNAQEQYVSTTGQYAYQSPSASDIRGPCPGLNAAANHGYLPRSGVATLENTITGLGALYSMSTDLAGFLAAYAILLDGNVPLMEWSIGGPIPLNGEGITGVGNGQGITWSHNKYEGDTSIGRCDAFVNDGDAHSLSPTRFRYAFESGMADDSYTFDTFSRAFAQNTHRSIQTNALYFAPLFSTTLVSPAAYNFVIAMMSNHTQQKPDGYLNGDIFKTFFGITGDYPNFEWQPGQERIPDNWYRRPSSQPYEAGSGVFGDLFSEYAAYPDTFRFGGNTNGVNTYNAIDMGSYTGGKMSGTPGNGLSQSDFQCLVYQSIQQGLPDAITSSSVFGPLLGAITAGIACPQVTQFNDNLINNYPGHNYSATGPATNC